MKNKRPHFTCWNCKKRVRMIIIYTIQGKVIKCPNCLCEDLIKRRWKEKHNQQ